MSDVDGTSMLEAAEADRIFRDASSRAVEAAEADRIFRDASSRAVATLIRVFGDIGVAEDAFAVALRRWPEDGLPPNPGGWITTTARDLTLDRLRRESR